MASDNKSFVETRVSASSKVEAFQVQPEKFISVSYKGKVHDLVVSEQSVLLQVIEYVIVGCVQES